MPKLDSIRLSVAQLTEGPPVVAIFTGGTTGIGAFTAAQLATTFAQHGSRLRVYIVGRNVTRAEDVIAKGKAASPGSEWHFVQVTDLALMSEVDRACDTIRQSERGETGRVCLLYMTHCYLIFKSRTTTTEGLDAFISTTYYSRIRFVLQLMPLLADSSIPGHVVSVYAGTFEDGTEPGELPIGCPPDAIYSLNTVRKYTSFMKTFMFEKLAADHKGKLALTHVYPGLVEGPAFRNDELPRWFKIAWPILKPLIWFSMTQPYVCGQVMLYLSTPRYPPQGVQSEQRALGGVEVAMSSQAEVGGGSYTVGQRGDDTGRVSYARVRSANTSAQVWDHTLEVLDGITRRNTQAS